MSIPFVVSVIGMTPFTASSEDVDFIDNAILRGDKIIILKSGIRFAAHSWQSSKPKYPLTQWVRDFGGDKETYKKAVKLRLTAQNKALGPGHIEVFAHKRVLRDPKSLGA